MSSFGFPAEGIVFTVELTRPLTVRSRPVRRVANLLLAAVGLFGVLSYLVGQRQGEIGIRLASGAQRKQVLHLMLLDGLRPAVAGLVLGLMTSAATARLIRSLLFGTMPLDPAVFVLAAVLLLAVAVVACLVPAWHAAQLDPMQALRTE